MPSRALAKASSRQATRPLSSSRATRRNSAAGTSPRVGSAAPIHSPPAKVSNADHNHRYSTSRVSQNFAGLVSGGGGLPFEPEQPAHVVNEIRQADLHGRPGEANGADEQAHPGFLLGEDVLDMGPDGRFSGIGSGGARRHRPAWRFLAMNAAHQHAFA